LQTQRKKGRKKGAKRAFLALFASFSGAMESGKCGVKEKSAITTLQKPCQRQLNQFAKSVIFGAERRQSSIYS
jgi:hypothetical protein